MDVSFHTFAHEYVCIAACFQSGFSRSGINKIQAWVDGGPSSAFDVRKITAKTLWTGDLVSCYIESSVDEIPTPVYNADQSCCRSHSNHSVRCQWKGKSDWQELPRLGVQSRDHLTALALTDQLPRLLDRFTWFLATMYTTLLFALLGTAYLN